MTRWFAALFLGMLVPLSIMTSGIPSVRAQVPPPLSLTKTFAVSELHVDQTTIMTLTLTNNTAAPLTGVGFTDDLPSSCPSCFLLSGLAAMQNSAAGTCNGTTTVPFNGRQITHTGASLAPGTSCIVTIGI